MQKREFDKTIQAILLCKLEKVELLSGEENSAASDYLLTVGYNSSLGEIPGGDYGEVVKTIFRDAEALGLLRVGEIKTVSETKNHVELSVKIHATPNTIRIWAAEPSIGFGAVPLDKVSVPLGFQAYILASLVLDIGAWVAILVGIIITSFFIPNMMRKGTIDLLLVKPIHRSVLLLYKFVGGLTFISLLTAYSIAGLWLVVGLRTGLWANAAFLLIFTITFFFAILYAISTLIAVITRSTIASILATLAIWFFFFVIGVANSKQLQNELLEKAHQSQGRIPPEQSSAEGTYARVLHSIHAVTPRTGELGYLNDLIMYCALATGNLSSIEHVDPTKIVWWQTALVASCWIAGCLAVACFVFSARDY